MISIVDPNSTSISFQESWLSNRKEWDEPTRRQAVVLGWMGGQPRCLLLPRPVYDMLQVAFVLRIVAPKRRQRGWREPHHGLEAAMKNNRGWTTHPHPYRRELEQFDPLESHIWENTSALEVGREPFFYLYHRQDRCSRNQGIHSGGGYHFKVPLGAAYALERNLINILNQLILYKVIYSYMCVLHGFRCRSWVLVFAQLQIYDIGTQLKMIWTQHNRIPLFSLLSLSFLSCH